MPTDFIGPITLLAAARIRFRSILYPWRMASCGDLWADAAITTIGDIEVRIASVPHLITMN